MQAQWQETGFVLGTAVMGFFVAVAALFAILGGFMLVIMLVAALLLSLPLMGLYALIVGLAHMVRPKRVFPLAATVAGGATEAPVLARLVKMRGSCASKVQYFTGMEFTFEEAGKVTPALCGPAFHGLLPYVRKLRAAEDGHEAMIQCPLSGSVLVFQLRVEERAKAA